MGLDDSKVTSKPHFYCLVNYTKITVLKLHWCLPEHEKKRNLKYEKFRGKAQGVLRSAKSKL